jgi:hypothetical protein
MQSSKQPRGVLPHVAAVFAASFTVITERCRLLKTRPLLEKLPQIQGRYKTAWRHACDAAKRVGLYNEQGLYYPQLTPKPVSDATTIVSDTLYHKKSSPLIQKDSV